MKAALPFRICFAILLLFAALHTFGFLHFTPKSAEGAAVKTAMDTVHFAFGNTTRTYGDLFRGAGLTVAAYLLFSALVVWQLPSMLATSRQSFRILAIGLLAAQTAALAVCFIFLAMPQVVFTGAVVACLVWGLVAAGSS